MEENLNTVNDNELLEEFFMVRYAWCYSVLKRSFTLICLNKLLYSFSLGLIDSFINVINEYIFLIRWKLNCLNFSLVTKTLCQINKVMSLQGLSWNKPTTLPHWNQVACFYSACQYEDSLNRQTVSWGDGVVQPMDILSTDCVLSGLLTHW